MSDSKANLAERDPWWPQLQVVIRRRHRLTNGDHHLSFMGAFAEFERALICGAAAGSPKPKREAVFKGRKKSLTAAQRPRDQPRNLVPMSRRRSQLHETCAIVQLGPRQRRARRQQTCRRDRGPNYESSLLNCFARLPLCESLKEGRLVQFIPALSASSTGTQHRRIDVDAIAP